MAKYIGTKVDVLDKGHVVLVNHMGNDESIVQAARTSYGEGTKKVNEDRGLIRYLIRNKHTSPIEMTVFLFHIKCPIYIFRQWIRHRTASVNETSLRYSIATKDTEKTDSNAWRLQSKNNKQGSSGYLNSWKDISYNSGEYTDPGTVFESPGAWLTNMENNLHETARKIYETRLELGIAREQARKDLPLSTYTEAYWKMDLHNLFHFLRLRLDSHAQLEIRQYAEAIYSLIKPIVPLACEAFEDYVLQAESFSRMEMEVLRHPEVLETIKKVASNSNIKELLSLGERREFKKKMGISKLFVDKS